MLFEYSLFIEHVETTRESEITPSIVNLFSGYLSWNYSRFPSRDLLHTRVAHPRRPDSIPDSDIVYVFGQSRIISLVHDPANRDETSTG